MVNHPNRSRHAIDAAIRRLLTKHNLQNVVVVVDGSGVFARALPLPYGPLAAARREILLGNGDHTLKDAERIREKVVLPVAYAKGKTLDEAVSALSEELATGRDANAPTPLSTQAERVVV